MSDPKEADTEKPTEADKDKAAKQPPAEHDELLPDDMEDKGNFA
ncbi:hypothetical protein [Sphingobium phenoxybenzoativorans]|nr:hypothetical protein [Sphingobium phenoxybenzoativorans]